MSTSDKKKLLFPISIILTITVSISVTEAATGVFSSLINELTEAQQINNVLINSTVTDTNSKVHKILVTSTNTNISLINGTIDNYNILIGTKPPVVTPPPITCQPGWHLENGVCVPDVIVPPTPTVGELKVIITADVEDTTAGNAVFNRIKAENPTNVFVLGDLGYESSLSWFKSTYGTLGNKVNCVAGNHEWANEDGTASLQTETSNYCGASSWYLKKGPTVFFGYNSNGDLTGQATSIGKLLTSTSFMQGVKSVHIMGHKGCQVPPNSHHGVEIQSFCDAIATKIPSTVKAFYDSGHNHVLSQSADLKYKQSGAGGRSHYECTSTTAWWCDNSHFGYLVYTIKPDGTTTHQFKDYNGVVLK